MFRPYIALFRLNTEPYAQENPEVFIRLYLQIDRRSHCTVSQYFYSTKSPIRDLGVDGKIILRWTFRKWDVGGMDWIILVQERDRWWALVNAAMNLRVA
jgi:hypothetical protein